jgi:hypothetical protein
MYEPRHQDLTDQEALFDAPTIGAHRPTTIAGYAALGELILAGSIGALSIVQSLAEGSYEQAIIVGESMMEQFDGPQFVPLADFLDDVELTMDEAMGAW